MAIEYNFKYMPLVGKLPGKSMAEQTETAINEIAQIVNENTAQAEIINTLAEEAKTQSDEALEKATEALETSSRVYIKETSVIDLDNYCESQLIYVGNVGSTHLPLLSKGFLEVKTNDDKSQATQVFIDDTNKDVYVRTGAITATTVGDVTTYTASYGTWVKSATIADLASYATLASPTFTGTVSAESIEASVGISAPNIDYFLWQPSTAYSVGDQVKTTSLPNNYVLVCTTAGTSGTTEPDYTGVSVGDTVTDWNVGWLVSTNACTVSPVFTGTPTAPSPATADDSTKIATTEWSRDVFLPLAGGTMTGNINSGQSSLIIYKNNSDGDLRLYAGSNTTKGAVLQLIGKDANSGAGRFYITASDGTNSTALQGRPDGTLMWGTNNILTTANGLPLSGGTMTGALKGNRTNNDFAITNMNADYGLLLYGYNQSENNGAILKLNSKEALSNAGNFYLKASDGTNKPALIGKPDGTLTWNSVNILEVGIVQAYAGSTTPTGWLLCDGSAVSRTTYANLFAVIGTTYGAGNGSTTFNLPNLVDKFVEGSTTSGTVKSAGLPNITGQFSINNPTGYMACLGSNSGAFNEVYNPITKLSRPNTYDDVNKNQGIKFDASASSSIYGNSNTVQPPALTMRYIIKY